jgi:hypothetical protein
MTLLNATGDRLLSVVIAVPCQDTVSSGFALDLAHLVQHTVEHNPRVKLRTAIAKGTILPQQRASLVKGALDVAATHILWLDSDMRFPPDALLRLLAHEEPIVAANYPTRRPPILPVAQHREHGHLFFSEEPGLTEVSHVGMGVMLVAARVYLETDQPWFAIGYNPKDQDYAGEDVFFCRKARTHGFLTLVDDALSLDVRHTGSLDFTPADANATRDAFQVA